MPTLASYRREMFQRAPGTFGRVESIGSLTTTTVVVSSLAVGGLSSQRYADRWLLRADASSAADRLRRCTAYASDTGTLTHAGTNYADTTATDELAEILEPQFEPYLLDNAINVTVQRLKRRDREILPTVSQQRRYDLADLDWIEEPGDIDSIYHSNNPVISRDRHMEKWNTVNSAGLIQPDWWTVSGSGASVERETGRVRRGRYSAALERSGDDTALSQGVGVLWNGQDETSLRGKTVTVVGVGWASTASQLRFRVTDGVSTENTSYHSGGSNWEELSATLTVGDAADDITISARVETTNGVAYVDELYIVENEVSDAIRADAYQETRLDRSNWGHEQNPLALTLPRMGRGGQYVVYSKRGYPAFDSTRLSAGTADGDSADAPLIPIATGAIARVFEGLARRQDENTTRYQQIAFEWGRRFEQLAESHYGQDPLREEGKDLFLDVMAPAARRY